jgi:acetolactate synthase-1/2/3 large subunit
MTLDVGKKIDQQAGDLWRNLGPAAFLIPIHPEQSYFPKITSRVLDNGAMESNPLHEMTPHLNAELRSQVIKYF